MIKAHRLGSRVLDIGIQLLGDKNPVNFYLATNGQSLYLISTLKFCVTYWMQSNQLWDNKLSFDTTKGSPCLWQLEYIIICRCANW